MLKHISCQPKNNQKFKLISTGCKSKKSPERLDEGMSCSGRMCLQSVRACSMLPLCTL
jgi:hypothetical protein